jgi:hypothetical protein
MVEQGWLADNGVHASHVYLPMAFGKDRMYA